MATKKNVTDSEGLDITGAGETVDDGELETGSSSLSSILGLNATDDTQALTQALARQYNNAQYQTRTADERQEQAEQEYKANYNAKRRSAQQSYESNDLALQQQINALQDTYDANRESTAQQYSQNYSTTDSNLLSRGMQRSSYGVQSLNDVLNAHAAAQADIDEEQATKANDLEAQRTQLTQQLNETLSGYDSDEADEILARVNELEETDYDRSVAAAETQTQIANQLYSNLYQAQRDQITDNQWLQQQNQAQAQWNKTNGLNEGSYYINTNQYTSGDLDYQLAGKLDANGNSSSDSGSSSGSSDSDKKKKTPTGGSGSGSGSSSSGSSSGSSLGASLSGSSLPGT